MESEPTVRRRPPWGILDAAGILALVLGMAWLLSPLPQSRRDALLERRLREDVAAVAETLRLRAEAGDSYQGLDTLLEDAPDLAARLEHWKPSSRPGVLEGHGCWLQVLLSDGEGRAVEAASADPTARDRGFLVLGWPMDPAATHARGQAALCGGDAWQFDGRPPRTKKGPPVPSVTFRRAGSSRMEPPYGWTMTNRWWKPASAGGANK